MESFIAQKAQFENEFYSFFQIHSIVSGYFLTLWGIDELYKLFMVKYEKY